MTPTFIQVEREQAKSWLRVLNHCRENLFLKDYVEHIDDASRAIKQALAAPAPAPGYCKHCTQYTIEEPLPAAQRQPKYNKTEMNCFVQNLYDEKMREGKHGHYETMFHVVHRAIEAAHGIGENT